MNSSSFSISFMISPFKSQHADIDVAHLFVGDAADMLKKPVGNHFFFRFLLRNLRVLNK